MQLMTSMNIKNINEIVDLYNYYSNNYIIDENFEKNIMVNLVEHNIHIINLMLHSSGLPIKNINLLSTASALIMSGLNIHEKVDNYGPNTFNLQLKVLTGDFYSAQYYKILADANLINDIKIFAHAVMQINEAKMYRHFADITKTSIEDYFSWLTQINTSLACNLINEYALEKNIWTQICINIFMAKALLNEQKYNIKSYAENISLENILLFKSLNNISAEEFNILINDESKKNELIVKFDIKNIINQYINKFIFKANKYVDSLDVKYIKDDLKSYISEHYREA